MRRKKLRKVGKSRVEQSRAEQSRAEQSREKKKRRGEKIRKVIERLTCEKKEAYELIREKRREWERIVLI